MRYLRFTKLIPRYDDSLSLPQANAAADTAKQTGQNAIGSYDPTAAGNSSTNAVTSNFNTAQGQNAQAVQPLTDVIKSNPTAQQLYQQGNNMFNVPALATQATNLTNRVNNVQPNAYNAARGFDISSTDINNGIANATAYLQPQANQATANFNTASGLASNFVNAGLTQNQMNLIPAQENAQLTAANQAAEATGWNQAQKSTLDGLVAKMNAGVQLSQSELQLAGTLAQQEEAYQQQLTQNQTTLANTIQGQKYQLVPAGNTLVNTLAQGIINPGTLASKNGYATY